MSGGTFEPHLINVPLVGCMIRLWVLERCEFGGDGGAGGGQKETWLDATEAGSDTEVSNGTAGLRLFHWWGTAPLAPDSVELDLGKLNSPEGSPPEAWASEGHASPLDCPWALAAAANRQTWTALAPRPQRNGFLIGDQWASWHRFRGHSAVAQTKLWDCEWVRRLWSWPDLNRHMMTHDAKDRWPWNGFWVNVLAFGLVSARCM